MSWILLSLLANVFFSCAVLLDKFLNTKKIKSVYSFAIVLNCVYFVCILITTYIQRKTFIFGISFFYSAIAGLFWFLMWMFYWKALQKGEVTRISAIFFSQPIYSAFIGVFIFHESLGALKWVGIIIIVGGAILSVLGGKHTTHSPYKAYFFAFLGAVFASIGNAFSKFAMQDLPSLTVNCIAFYVTIPLYLLFLRDRRVVAEVVAALRNIPLLMKFAIRGLLGYLGIISILRAMEIGPISLVSAINGSQPLFILVLSLAVIALYPKLIQEEFGKKALITKTIALVLTVIGVLLVSF